jgi:hypothetical protein
MGKFIKSTTKTATMYRINKYHKAVVIAENLEAKVKEIEVHKICNGTATKCEPELGREMISLIQRESAASIAHLETLINNWYAEQ